MRWLSVILVAVLGIGVAIGAEAPDAAWAGAVLGAASWLVAMHAWRRRAGRWVTGAALIALASLGVTAGAVAMRRALHPPLVRTLEAALLPDDGRATAPLRLDGRLVADAWSAGPTVLLRVAVERVAMGPCGCPTSAEGEVQLGVGGTLAVSRREQWRAGRHVTVEATLRRPGSYRNLGAPDEASLRARGHLALVGQVKSGLQVEVAAGDPVNEAMASLRAHVRSAIARAAGTDVTAAALATAVLIGDRAGLDPALELRLQRAGTFHVVAISGGNVALWAAGTIWIATRLVRRRAVAFGGAALVLIGYAALVGGGASVQRATGMALVGLATRWLDLRGAALNVLALTAGVLIVADPLLVFDVAFWLTSLATLGLVVGLPDAGGPTSRAVRLARSLFLTSVCAEAALLPIVAAVFQQVTLAGLLLSAVAVPAMAVVQASALAVTLLDVISWRAASWPGLVMTASVHAIVDSARLLDVAPWLSWRVPPPRLAPMAGYYVALGAWLWLRTAAGSAQAPIERFSAVVAGVSAIWIASAPLTLLPSAPGDLRFVSFDVGQGAAALLQFPRGHRMLVDAGGVTGRGRDLGALVVGPTLRARGIRRVDTIVVTHADLDHAGGAASLIREFHPTEVWMGIPVAGDLAMQEIGAAVLEVGAVWRWARRGESLEVDGVRVGVVHPPPPDWERQRVRNDDSIVLAVDYGAVRLLLPGDVGAEVEPAVSEALAALGDAPPLVALLVGHHGSAGSSSPQFLASARPAVAIVSVGRANPFGHPAPATIARLTDVGAPVWRTDLDGEVTLRTDGTRLELSGITGRRATVVEPSRQPR